MKLVKQSVAILSLAAISSLAFAATPGSYIGGGLGASKQLTPNEFLIQADDGKMSRESGGLGGRVFGGYNFNQYFGIEAGLAHYAPSIYKASTNDVKASLEYKLNSFDVVGKAYLPFGQSGFNAYVLGGGAYAVNERDFKVSPQEATDNKPVNDDHSTSKIRPIYGAGVSYDIPQTNFVTNLEFSRLQGVGNIKNDKDAISSANMLTLNIAYNIGQ